MDNKDLLSGILDRFVNASEDEKVSILEIASPSLFTPEGVLKNHLGTSVQVVNAFLQRLDLQTFIAYAKDPKNGEIIVNVLKLSNCQIVANKLLLANQYVDQALEVIKSELNNPGEDLEDRLYVFKNGLTVIGDRALDLIFSMLDSKYSVVVQFALCVLDLAYWQSENKKLLISKLKAKFDTQSDPHTISLISQLLSLYDSVEYLKKITDLIFYRDIFNYPGSIVMEHTHYAWGRAKGSSREIFLTAYYQSSLDWSWCYQKSCLLAFFAMSTDRIVNIFSNASSKQLSAIVSGISSQAKFTNEERVKIRESFVNAFNKYFAPDKSKQINIQILLRVSWMWPESRYIEILSILYKRGIDVSNLSGIFRYPLSTPEQIAKIMTYLTGVLKVDAAISIIHSLNRYQTVDNSALTALHSAIRVLVDSFRDDSLKKEAIEAFLGVHIKYWKDYTNEILTYSTDYIRVKVAIHILEIYDRSHKLAINTLTSLMVKPDLNKKDKELIKNFLNQVVW